MPQTEWKRSACPYDCPDGCGLLVETDGTTVYRVKGDPEHPVTKGFLCRKMAHYERTVHSPARILTPLRRTGQKGEGAFAPISWDEALAEISSRWKDVIARFGAEAILPYSYAGTEHKIQFSCGDPFFHFLGASRLERTICAKAKDEGFGQIIGSTPGRNPCEMAGCDYIVIWGSNVAATWIHAQAEILQAKKRGAHVVLVETYKTPAASLADEVLLVRPGTDACLALAMDNLLKQEGKIDQAFLARYALGWEEFLASLEGYTLEEAERVTAVPRDQIVSVARGFAAARSPVILFGAGMSRHQNGAMAVRCVATLAAVTGAFAKPCGGIIGNASSSAAFYMDRIKRPDFAKPGVRTINMNQLGTALCDQTLAPPIMSLYVYSANPACITPHQSAVLRGLAREDLFTVVHERFLTDTAKFADIVLPADTALEHGDLAASYGNLCVQKTAPVIAPLGGSKSNWETFSLLAKAMGFADPFFDQTNEELKERVAALPTGWVRRWSAEERRRFDAGYAVLLPAPDPCAFGTESGKIEFLRPELPEPLPRYVPEPGEYPLHLVVAPHQATLNSSFLERPELVEKRGPMTLLVSPADAAARRIADGSVVEAHNDLAHVQFRAAVTDKVLPGTVVAEGVYSAAQSLNGLTVNALLGETLTDYGAAATLCGNTVELRCAETAGGGEF